MPRITVEARTYGEMIAQFGRALGLVGNESNCEEFWKAASVLLTLAGAFEGGRSKVLELEEHVNRWNQQQIQALKSGL